MARDCVVSSKAANIAAVSAIGVGGGSGCCGDIWRLRAYSVRVAGGGCRRCGRDPEVLNAEQQFLQDVAVGTCTPTRSESPSLRHEVYQRDSCLLPSTKNTLLRETS
jgi:hypothetical protein